MPARKRPQLSKTKSNPNIPADLRQMIDQSFPDGVVEMRWPSEEAEEEMLDKIEQLTPKIRRIQGLKFVHEHAAEEEKCEREWDHDDEFPESVDPGRSYHTFFLVLPGEQFQYKTELERLEFDEESEEDDLSGDSIPGQGEIGLIVGVSLLAPIAMIATSYQESFDDGTTVEPDFRRPELEYPIQADIAAELKVLSSKVVKILEKQSLRVLTADESGRKAPWLKPGEEINVMEGEVTVFDAFFFHDIV